MESLLDDIDSFEKQLLEKALENEDVLKGGLACHCRYTLIGMYQQ